MTSSVKLADEFVSLFTAGPGGCYGVRLTAPGLAPVVVGRTANPAVAREWVEATRRFVAAAVRAARQEARVSKQASELLTEISGLSTDVDGGRLVGLPD